MILSISRRWMRALAVAGTRLVKRRLIAEFASVDPVRDHTSLDRYAEFRMPGVGIREYQRPGCGSQRFGNLSGSRNDLALPIHLGDARAHNVLQNFGCVVLDDLLRVNLVGDLRRIVAGVVTNNPILDEPSQRQVANRPS